MKPWMWSLPVVASHEARQCSWPGQAALWVHRLHPSAYLRLVIFTLQKKKKSARSPLLTLHFIYDVVSDKDISCLSDSARDSGPCDTILCLQSNYQSYKRHRLLRMCWPASQFHFASDGGGTSSYACLGYHSTANFVPNFIGPLSQWALVSILIFLFHLQCLPNTGLSSLASQYCDTTGTKEGPVIRWLPRVANRTQWLAVSSLTQALQCWGNSSRGLLSVRLSSLLMDWLSVQTLRVLSGILQ